MPDRGEIIGAATLEWQADGERIKLGSMPLKVGGIPGLIIPPAGPGGTHDFGVFHDPPASLTSGAPPAKGKAFHVNSAHVVLREGNGGTLALNVRMPEPLGPDGNGSDQSIVHDVRGNNLARASGYFDKINVDIPPIKIAPGVVEFNGGKLSRDIKRKPPWQATGSLNIFTKKVDMSPDSKQPGCSVVGGLGFFEDGGLESAGAIIDGLKIPIPNPPAPPATALVNPALQIRPKTSVRPLILTGCLALEDYPAGKAFRVTGCVGFLSAGSGVAVPPTEKLAFCPDNKGNETFALNDRNSTPGPNGRRILRGIVVRVSGDVALGPSHFSVAKAYIEFREDPFAIEFKGSMGIEVLDGHVKVGAELFGYFYNASDWAVGGQGGITQDLICVPIAGCPSVSLAALVSSKGIGACASIFAIGIGASVRFSDGRLFPHFPGCDLEDLKDDLGIGLRALPNPDRMLLRGHDPVAVISQVRSGTVAMDGDSPYSLIVVRGTDKSPVVEVRDPSGKVVLNDTGAPVQGLKAPDRPPAPGAAKPVAPNTNVVDPPQGILHNDASTYHDAKVDLRHTTLILLRAPKRGRYTITAKEGSSAITSISHSDAAPTTALRAVVTGKGTRRTLSVKGALPAGSTVSVTEEGRNLIKPIGGAVSAQASSVGAVIARVNRNVAFKPALGPAGKRQIVAVVSRDGIPEQRIVLGSYTAPAVPKAGAVRGLNATRRGNALTVAWRPIANAKRITVTVALRGGVKRTETVSGKGRRIVLRDALVRSGATVRVQAVGPLSVAGRAATKRLKAEKVKRVKRFVL